jgi:hypothetical protein
MGETGSLGNLSSPNGLLPDSEPGRRHELYDPTPSGLAVAGSRLRDDPGGCSALIAPDLRILKERLGDRVEALEQALTVRFRDLE